jgi:hypothetical protein
MPQRAGNRAGGVAGAAAGDGADSSSPPHGRAKRAPAGLAGAAAAPPPAPAAAPSPAKRSKSGSGSGRSKSASPAKQPPPPRGGPGRPPPPGGVPEKLGEGPLRLIIIGHNPSDHAWRSGHFYSNPANRMWPLLMRCRPEGVARPRRGAASRVPAACRREKGVARRSLPRCISERMPSHTLPVPLRLAPLLPPSTGIAPPEVKGPQDDGLMPGLAGVGFTDIGTGHPGTDRCAARERGAGGRAGGRAGEQR